MLGTIHGLRLPGNSYPGEVSGHEPASNRRPDFEVVLGAKKKPVHGTHQGEAETPRALRRGRSKFVAQFRQSITYQALESGELFGGESVFPSANGIELPFFEGSVGCGDRANRNLLNPVVIQIVAR